METYPEKPLLDMTPDGRFRTPAKPPLAARIAAVALLVAVIAAGLSIAAFAIWVAFMLIPVILVAGVIGYLALRFQLRRGSFSGARYVYRSDNFRR